MKLALLLLLATSAIAATTSIHEPPARITPPTTLATNDCCAGYAPLTPFYTVQPVFNPYQPFIAPEGPGAPTAAILPCDPVPEPGLSLVLALALGCFGIAGRRKP